MGSVAFGGEDESYKFPTMILDGCGAVNYASIPRKIWPAIKKRGRECTSPLLTSRTQHRASTTVDTLRKEAGKISKLDKKQRRITKTLYALAGMFSDADHQKIEDEEDIRPTPQEETRKISSKLTLGAVCPSTAEVDLVPSPNLATRCETYNSCRLFEGTIFPSRPRLVENKISTEKHARVAAEPNKSWKRQPNSENKWQKQQYVYFSAIDSVAAENDSSETRKGILLHKWPIQDQQMASETSAKQGYDFLSLGTKLRGLDTGENANGAGCFLKPPKQYHMPSQNQSNVLCSLPLYGYSSSAPVKAINTTLALNRRRNLPFGFERNGTLFHPENMACNHNL